MKKLLTTATALVLTFGLHAADTPDTNVTVDLSGPGKPISADLFGIFFEDLNYAADGGLYAELIQNRSFEYQATEQPTWNALSFWELTKRGGSEGQWAVEGANPIHPNNPHYVILSVTKAGEGLGLVNGGFDGIPIKMGESYDVTFFARQLYTDRRKPVIGQAMPVTVRLENSSGENLGEVGLEIDGRDWKRTTGSIVARGTEANARFVLLARATGAVALDEISLFPHATFRHRANGLRADIAQAIADLKPKFMRFPGGCLTHGDGINNFYRWKDTIGPIEQRRGQANIWRYHQSVGLGYFEYFQFCEDIGAKPVPVLPAAVSCQNADHLSGTGQQCLPLADMKAYIQDVLDLIEYANGPATSSWGAKRAAAGHPAPFHLEYLGLGNEDKITPGFKERFAMIYEAVKAVHPEIKVIGTVGPGPNGEDFDAGWKFAETSKVPIVDEHYYQPADWFWQNLRRYDAYDRSHSLVYVGEYSAHDATRRMTLGVALAEAAYMTNLERNGDVVHMASYAPLLGKRGFTQWNPDLIYFTNTQVAPSVNYYVQQLFMQNTGDTYLPATTDGSGRLAISAVKESRTGEFILKIVNGDPVSKVTTFHLLGARSQDLKATKIVLTGDAAAVDTFDTANPVRPETSAITIGAAFKYQVPPTSLTVIRIEAR